MRRNCKSCRWRHREGCMALHIMLGSSGAGKTFELYQHAINESMVNAQTNYIILVPEQFTLQTQKDLVQLHPRHGIMNIDVLSFLRLAYRVFEETGKPNRVMIEDTGKSMVVKKVLLEKRSELVRYGANINKPGFVDEMKSLISEFYQYSVGDQAISKMEELAGHQPLLKHKIKDIKTIFEGFQEFLRERYITNEELLDVLSEMICRSGMVKKSVICLDGYTGFTPTQYKVLSELMLHAKELFVTVTMDPEEADKSHQEHDLFYLSKNTIDKLKKNAKEAGIPVILHRLEGTPKRFFKNEPLAFLEKEIYRYSGKIYNKKQEDIRIFAAKDALQEVIWTVGEIKHLLRNNQYRYREIAIVTGTMERYGRFIRREFERAGLPCFLDETRTMLSNPVVELLRAVIDIVEQDYSYDSVFRYLKSGLVSYDREEIDILENYVIALGIRGHARWIKEFTRKYRTRQEIPLERMNAIRKQIIIELEPVYQTLSKKGNTVKIWITALHSFFVEHNVEEQMDVFAEKWKLSPEPELRLKAKEYEQVYRLTMELFDRVVELLGSDCLPLREFRDILETGFREAKLSLIPPGVDQIVAGDIERTRLKDIKVLFFLGVNEGVIPRTKAGGGLLSDTDRELFSQNGIELSPTREQSAYTAEFYLYLSLTKPQQKLYLSYAGLEGKKTAWPSPLIARVKQLFSKIKVETDADYKNQAEFILGTDRGLTYFIQGLRAEQGNKQSDDWSSLFHLYRKQEPGIFKRLMEAACYHREEQGLSSKTALSLYGSTLLGSATRMERYAACAFAHFLSYGLKLEERAEYRIAMPDIGNIFHTAMELFGKKLKATKSDWHHMTHELREALGKECVREATWDYGNGILDSSRRNAYLITKVERILSRTLLVVEQQIKAGKFEPFAYEEKFSHNDRFLKLSGRIDRLDMFEEENHLFLRVVDYKTGRASFDLNQLYYGLQTQLGIYLESGMEMVGRLFPEKKIIPAGMLYYQIDDPIVSKSSQAEFEIQKALMMNGLVNRSVQSLTLQDGKFTGEEGSLAPMHKSIVIPVGTTKSGELTKTSGATSEENLKGLKCFLDKQLSDRAKEIILGKTDLSPYRLGSKTACDYCLYPGICGFDSRMPDNQYKYLKKMSKEEVWDKILQREDSTSGEKVDTRATENHNT